ncbi:MAG: RsmB/NOP family class I SAM-dependent RNA methyltransferase [Bacillota bacterium]|nr:RsmB/NOP family class I SAM-dependent RNA methyltransferase [Bacillota bacterium]
MLLPNRFTSRMKNLLQDEYQNFIASYSQPSYLGLRINTLKIPVEKFMELNPFQLEPVPWVQEGFYYQESERPSKHPYYHAGLYYLQEPSAMAPAAFLEAKPGERVLDLCAAPGGKATQLAASIKGQGLLVVNDINAERTKPLVKNLELCGATNFVAINETPENLAKVFPGYFDKIIIDAPCSGEGMFRKDSSAIKSWEDYTVEVCVTMQENILQVAASMLKPGGQLLYSTCTFSPEENESRINKFLDNNAGYELVPIEKKGGMASGRPEWANGRQDLALTARFWPHLIKGEGHFLALIQKQNSCHSQKEIYGPITYNSTFKKDITKEARYEITDFWTKYIKKPLPKGLVQVKSYIYYQPSGLPDLMGLKVIRAGWYLGEAKKGRFEPSQALVMGLTKSDLQQVLDLPTNSQEVIRYLKGETIENPEGFQGWVAVCVAGFPLGWAKGQGGLLKNHYFKGWRMMS